MILNRLPCENCVIMLCTSKNASSWNTEMEHKYEHKHLKLCGMKCHLFSKIIQKSALGFLSLI